MHDAFALGDIRTASMDQNSILVLRSHSNSYDSYMTVLTLLGVLAFLGSVLQFDCLTPGDWMSSISVVLKCFMCLDVYSTGDESLQVQLGVEQLSVSFYSARNEAINVLWDLTSDVITLLSMPDFTHSYQSLMTNGSMATCDEAIHVDVIPTEYYEVDTKK